MMKKIVKTVVAYQCKVCKTEYEKKSDAEKCEAGKLEEKKFKVGETVRAKEKRTCLNVETGGIYICEGTIVKIIGPKPADYEYEVKWLNGDPERLNGHVWIYEIKYECPRCKKNKGVRYYAPEIEKINPTK